MKNKQRKFEQWLNKKLYAGKKIDDHKGLRKKIIHWLNCRELARLIKDTGTTYIRF